jgi:hypothetical protein
MCVCALLCDGCTLVTCVPPYRAGRVAGLACGAVETPACCMLYRMSSVVPCSVYVCSVVVVSLVRRPCACSFSASALHRSSLSLLPLSYLEHLECRLQRLSADVCPYLHHACINLSHHSHRLTPQPSPKPTERALSWGGWVCLSAQDGGSAIPGHLLVRDE